MHRSITLCAIVALLATLSASQAVAQQPAGLASVSILGTGPGEYGRGRVDTGVSMDYLTQPNTCYTLADYNIDFIDQIDLTGAGTGKTTLALFDAPRCVGGATPVVAAGADRTVVSGWNL